MIDCTWFIRPTMGYCQVAGAIGIDDFWPVDSSALSTGLAFPGLWDKGTILFPEQVGGRWVMYHRVEPASGCLMPVSCNCRGPNKIILIIGRVQG